MIEAPDHGRRRARLRLFAATGVAEIVVVDPESLPPVLFLPELSRVLRCSESTITRRLADGDFPLRPLPSIDRRPRWSRDRVLEWIDQVPPGSRRRRSPLSSRSGRFGGR